MKIQPFSKTYDGVTVLDFPGFDLKPGTIYSIIGSNGSGKSTFAKILASALPADQGKRYLDEGICVGYMPQKNYAFRMSTQANILLGGSDRQLAAARMELLQLSHLSAKRADRLSGGETARMALARLTMGSYDLVILDEPTAAMDMETTSLAEQLILQYVQETGCTLILVTHSLAQAMRTSSEVLYFHRGKLLESGPVSQVLQAPSAPETKHFLEFYGV